LELIDASMLQQQHTGQSYTVQIWQEKAMDLWANQGAVPNSALTVLAFTMELGKFHVQKKNVS